MNNVKKSIGWADWTINPVKGLCPVGCPYCYARRAYGRNCNATFKDKSIRYEPSVWRYLNRAKPGARIFVGSTIDLFHPECRRWDDSIFEICAACKELTFIFLTKCPENLPREWPDNCWVGVSATNLVQYGIAGIYLPEIKAKVKFISFEPLLSEIQPDNQYSRYTTEMMAKDFRFAGINWLIIGQQTPVSKKTTPRIEWIQEIVTAADKANIPVFLKGNLDKLLTDDKETHAEFWTSGYDEDGGERIVIRQEFPKI
jgi:protein gp37